MRKSTPGPWHCENSIGYIFDKNCGVLVCQVGGYQDTGLLEFNKERWDADVRLISAAPELLAALKSLDDTLCRGFETYDYRMAARKAMVAARNIIAKVENAK
jgi:hypothetical protein